MKLIFAKQKNENPFGSDYFSEVELTDLVAMYFRTVYDIYLEFHEKSVHHKATDGPYFRVSYNDFHHFYSFSFIGGKDHIGMANTVRNIFIKQRYEVSEFQRTWRNASDGRINGVEFWIDARDK